LKVLPLLLPASRFETLCDIAENTKATTVFLPHSAGAVSDVASQIRNGILQADAAVVFLSLASSGDPTIKAWCAA
jgi:hypothetical protein